MGARTQLTLYVLAGALLVYAGIDFALELINGGEALPELPVLVFFAALFFYMWVNRERWWGSASKSEQDRTAA